MRMQSCRVCERVCTLKANKNETHAPTKLSSKRAMQWMCTIYLCYVHDVIGWNGKIAGNWGKRLVHPADTWISEYGNACTHTHTHLCILALILLYRMQSMRLKCYRKCVQNVLFQRFVFILSSPHWLSYGLVFFLPFYNTPAKQCHASGWRPRTSVTFTLNDFQ